LDTPYAVLPDSGAQNQGYQDRAVNGTAGHQAPQTRTSAQAVPMSKLMLKASLVALATLAIVLGVPELLVPTPGFALLCLLVRWTPLRKFGI